MNHFVESDEISQPVPAWPFWEFDCPECGEIVKTEHAPPAQDECDACGATVRTDAR